MGLVIMKYYFSVILCHTLKHWVPNLHGNTRTRPAFHYYYVIPSIGQGDWGQPFHGSQLDLLEASFVCRDFLGHEIVNGLARRGRAGGVAFRTSSHRGIDEDIKLWRCMPGDSQKTYMGAKGLMVCTYVSTSRHK